MPGDPISVVAPSGPFDDELLRQGLARLGAFDVRVPEQLWSRREGFFAGSDTVRLLELQGALDDTEARAILIARGGYGIGPLLPRLDLSGFERAPKWLMGFSDATVLHAAVNQLGVCSLHGANGTTLSRATTGELGELFALLQGPTSQLFSGLDAWVSGAAEGPLFGGNLTVLFAEAASGRLRIPRGAILFLEDVTETSYRVDRMLAALGAGGHFDHVAGVVLGDFVDCSEGKFGVPTEAVLKRNLQRLGVPVLSGLPCGHGPDNRPLLLGATATLDAARGSLRVEA